MNNREWKQNHTPATARDLTASVGALIDHLRQWPMETSVVLGEEYTVTDDEGLVWRRTRFHAVKICTSALGEISPILLQGEEL